MLSLQEHIFGTLGPETKSPQSLISDVVGGGVVPTHDEATPFNVNASNSTSPLENWNLTALSKVTSNTVIVLTPRVKATGFPKKLLPLNCCFKYSKSSAPPAGNDVTFISNV